MAKECKKCGKTYARNRREAPGLCPHCAFWSCVDKTSSPCGCWLWMGPTRAGSQCGYGMSRFKTPDGNIERAAHRISWVMTNGDIPDDLFVLHNCDGLYPVGDITNRRCVNPSHLRLGTQFDNIADSVERGRMASGPRHGMNKHPERRSRGQSHANSIRHENRPRGTTHKMAKLNDDLVREIRSSKETGRALAKRLNVSFQVISNIRRRKIWRHIV